MKKSKRERFCLFLSLQQHNLDARHFRFCAVLVFHLLRRDGHRAQFRLGQEFVAHYLGHIDRFGDYLPAGFDSHQRRAALELGDHRQHISHCGLLADEDGVLLAQCRSGAGLVKFMLACSIGAAANVGVASYIYVDWGNWLWSGLTGILVGMLWNYAATAIVVWPRRRRP